ncbi:MAG: hypothetical protein M0R37_03960 [Bacteroidales bacterium]|nr:hypothetical protein [Bacteroidales bacterium]
MATLLSYPDALSLASNLKKFSIAASDPISFKLYQSDELLLDETYTPNASGRIEIDVREIIKSQLSFILPTSDSFQQTALFKPFRALIDATEVSFVAIRSGVENFSDTAVNFLKTNWLTWQPQTKRVAYSQPEWLTYYAPVTCSIKVKFYLKDGSSEVVTLADQAAGTCFTYNVMYSYIMSIQDSECYGYYDLYVEDMAGTRLSYIQRYVYKKATIEDETYLFENSLGGLDTVVFNGALTFAPELEHTEGLYDDSSQQLETTFTRKYQQVTGNLSKVECSWIWDLFVSGSAYKLQTGTLRKITLIESSPERTSIEPLVSFPFTYRMSVDQGLQSVPRTMGTLPDNLEISTPEQLFFLAPRLVEFESAALEDSLLFPVQTPFTTIWKKLSWGAIWNFLYEKILASAIGLMAHVHENLSVINKLSESAGKLQYNGSDIGGSGVGGVVLGETSATAYRGDRGAQMYKERKKSALPNGYGTLILTDIPALEEHYISIHITGMGLGGLQPFSMIAQARTSSSGFVTNHFKAIACGQKLNLYAFRIIPEGKESHVIGFWISPVQTSTNLNPFMLYNDITVIADGSRINHVSSISDSPIPSSDESYADGYNYREITGAVKDLDNVDLSNYYTKAQTDTRYPILSSGKILAANLPSYVDDVIEGIYVNPATFTVSGSAITPETGKIYVSIDTNLTYRWSGSAFVIMSTSLALGETSATAYRGDRGKTAYDHSQNANVHISAELKTAVENATSSATANTFVKRDSNGKSAFAAVIINGIELTVE